MRTRPCSRSNWNCNINQGRSFIPTNSDAFGFFVYGMLIAFVYGPYIQTKRYTPFRVYDSCAQSVCYVVYLVAASPSLAHSYSLRSRFLFIFPLFFPFSFVRLHIALCSPVPVVYMAELYRFVCLLTIAVIVMLFLLLSVVGMFANYYRIA